MTDYQQQSNRQSGTRYVIVAANEVLLRESNYLQLREERVITY
jgi:hypothetical protein